MRLPPWGRRARRGGTARATEGPVKRDARGISFSLCGHSLTRAWDGRFWKMRFLAVRGNPNLATPAKRHTGARHRAARAPHTQREITRQCATRAAPRKK